MDLHDNTRFQRLDAELLSISPDSVEDWAEQIREFGIETPSLSDADNKVATAYGVMQWAMGSEPGHTFVLVDKQGTIRWIRDYGAPENGGVMYVVPDELVPELEKSLD